MGCELGSEWGIPNKWFGTSHNYIWIIWRTNDYTRLIQNWRVSRDAPEKNWWCVSAIELEHQRGIVFAVIGTFGDENEIINGTPTLSLNQNAGQIDFSMASRSTVAELLNISLLVLSIPPPTTQANSKPNEIVHETKRCCVKHVTHERYERYEWHVCSCHLRVPHTQFGSPDKSWWSYLLQDLMKLFTSPAGPVENVLPTVTAAPPNINDLQKKKIICDSNLQVCSPSKVWRQGATSRRVASRGDCNGRQTAQWCCYPGRVTESQNPFPMIRPSISAHESHMNAWAWHIPKRTLLWQTQSVIETTTVLSYAVWTWHAMHGPPRCRRWPFSIQLETRWCCPLPTLRNDRQPKHYLKCCDRLLRMKTLNNLDMQNELRTTQWKWISPGSCRLPYGCWPSHVRWWQL